MADQQLSNSSFAIARVSSNQPSYSYKSTAAVVGSCAYFCTALVKSFITSKEFTMSTLNLSALSAVASVVVNSVKKVAPSKSMRNKIARASRKAQHRLAAAKRRARQAKNGWVCSPAYQAICRKQNRFIPAIPTIVRNGQPPVKVAIKYSRLSDGQGEYKLTPAVRVHRTFVAPRTRVEQIRDSIRRGEQELNKLGRPRTRAEKRAEKARKQRQQWRKEGVLNTSAEVKLPKLDRKERKLRKRLAALAASPVARPQDFKDVADELLEVERKANRLAEEVCASSEKKEERKEEKAGVSAGVETPKVVDTFLEQLEALREAIDVNLSPEVGVGLDLSSYKEEAATIVASFKTGTGADDMKMSMGSKMPVTLEKVEWVEGMLLSINKDNKQAIHNHLKGVRPYKVSFHIPTCTIRGAAQYLLNIGFQVHPTVPDLLWLAENTVVKALESPSNEKKEKREVKNKPSNGVTRLENFDENSQQLFVTNADRTSLHIVLAGKARGKHVLFNKAECTVEGAADYLLSLKFEVHPESDWLWLDKNLSVKPLGEPRKKKEESIEKEEQTVQQTYKRPVSGEPAGATQPAKERHNSTTPQLSVTEVVKMFDPGTTFNELYPVKGLTSLFTFEHTGMSDAEKAKKDEIAILASNIRMEDKVFAKCTMNVPSPCIDPEFINYWTDDVHPREKDNLLSGGTEPGNKLPYNSSPFNLCVAQYCVNGSTAQFTPAMYASKEFKGEKATLATAGIQFIIDMFDAGYFTPKKAIPRDVVGCRQDIRAAVEAGKSIQLESFDSQGNETYATLTYNAEKGLAEILKDGKKQTLVTVASFKEDKVKCANEGGLQWRIYPYKVEVFLVEDREAILGSKNILNFCPYALLGVEAPKAQAAAAPKETKVTKPVTQVQAERTVEQPAEATEQATSSRRRPKPSEVEKAIVAANVNNELEALYKAVNLTFDTLGAPVEFDKAALRKKYRLCGEDEAAAQITLEYIFSRTKGNPVQYYSWTPEDVKGVLETLEAYWSKNNTVNGGVATLSYHMTEEKELNINFGGVTAILISTDGRAYDQEGRSFEQAIEVSGYHKLSSKEVLVDDKLLPQEVKTPHVTLVKPASSTGKFMQAFCGFLLMLSNNKINVRDGLAANFPQLLREGDDMFPLTLSEVLGQNGGFLHGLQNNMKVLIHRPFNPNVEFTPEQTGRLAHSTAFLMRGEIEKDKSKKMWLAEGAIEPISVTTEEIKELLRLKAKGQVVKTLKDSEGEVEQAAMLAAMPKYRSLGFHFSKGVFLAGITHVSLALAQEHAPNLFARMLLATGLKAEVAADYVVSLTLKASKGAKRATLSMAKAVHVVGEVEAGYRYYNQTKLLKGWLVQECMAPTFVMPPGMALFLGTEAEKPVGYFKKTERLVFADYTAGDNLPTAVTLEGQSIIEHCLDEYAKPIYSFDEIKGVHTLKFSEKPVVLFGTKLAWIPKEAGVWGSVEFKQHDRADLAEIRWSEVQTVGKATELAVEYDYYLTHRNPKLRGIIKAMMGQAKPEILYNAMNPNLKELGLGDIKLIAPQDTIKSDMLYSWLQVIGNTLRYSNPEAEAIKKLQEFKEQIHASLGLKAGLPYLVIEQYSVTALLYQPMIDYFEATFGRAIWMHVAQCGDQGTIMTELYSRKVKAEFGWVDVPSSSNWGDEELALYYRLQAKGKKMGIIAESIDYANDPKQNAIIFVSKDDVLVEYYQRSYCFIGAPGAPVYGVELFESSTVAEAISDSRHMASSVRSFSRMPGAPAAEMFEAAKKLLDAGKESMFMSLVIAGMASGDNFDCSKVVKFISLKDPKKEIDSLSLAPADIAYLKELLAASDIDVTLAHHEKDLFKSVAHCFREVVFDVAGKKLWLNALLAIASLKSEDSSNNISQKFFRDILVPCLNGVTVTTLEEKRVSGILDKLCDSKKTKELISAAGNVTGKRIALPNIPTGEIWVLYSSAPNSVCQKLARSGFKIDKIQSGEVTVFNHNSRAPLTDGPILKLRIIKDEENEANFYQINADSVGLSPISCAMDLGDFDGDGHYFVQLEGKFEATSFEENVEFLNKVLGYPMFNVFTNEKDEPNEEKDNLNEQYAADHYNIKPWEKVALTLSGTPKSVKSSKVTMTLDKYIDFNQKSREVQTKAVGIAHSIFMWSEHLVDILLAAQKLGIDIDHIDSKTGIGWSWSNAANADLVPGVAAMYEIILGGFSNPAWTVYSKYLKGIKEGERTVARPNLKEFNQDIVALGMAGDKPEGFLKLMLAAHQLFFLEKHGKFCDHVLSNGVPTKMAVQQNIKQMLAVALVSFELLRGKFAGFNGVLADNSNPKATGHKIAMTMARTFLKENPEMIKESLVCYQLNQVIEECDWLLYGAEAEERSGRRAAGEVVPSKLQPHQLEYFRALAAKGIVEIEAETVDVEPVVETVEETVNWVEADIVVIEEDDAASTERFFLQSEEVWEHEHRNGVYMFHNQKEWKEWTAFLNLDEEQPESAAYAEEFTNARLVKGRFITPQRVVETPEIGAELPVEKEAQQAPVSFDSALEEAIATLEFDKEGFVTNWLDCALLLVEWSEANIVLKDSSYALENGRSLTVDSLPLNSGLYVFKAGDKYIIFDDIAAPETDKADEEYIELISSWAEGIGANVEALEEINRVWFIKGRIIHENKPTSELSQQLAVEELEALLPQEEECPLFEEPVEIESVVIEDEEQEEAHSVLKQLVEVKENLPADKWGDVLSFVRGLVAEVQAEAVKPVVVEPAVVEPAVVEPVVQEAPKQNPLIQSLVSVVNKKHSYDSPEEVRVDGDRESLLGNPFKHDYRNEALRTTSVAAYGNYYNLVVYHGVEPVEAAQTVLRSLDNNFHIARVWKKPTRKNFLSAIAQLWDKVEEHGFVEVKCWCSPKQCHLDVVKADLEEADSRAVWEASIYVAPVVVEELIMVPELTEAEQNEVDAQEATVVAWDNSIKKPERAATLSSRRVPLAIEEEKQAPLAIAPDTQKDEEGGSPVVRRMPRPKSDGGAAALVDELFVAKHPLDGLPAVPGAERNKIKDDAMAAIATQFIGFPAKPGVASSTENYRKAWGDKANTGIYTADDIIMVSGSGVFRGVTIADAAKVFNERYIPLVDKAIAASSKFVVGGCSGVDELLKSYVESKNYSAKWIACSYKGYWLLTPAAPKATGRARSVVELDSLDWLTPYIEKLETWTANEVTALVKGLNPEQQQALRLILLGGNYVLTGNAGTGKSHLSSVAVKILKLLGYWIVPVATTGLASMNLQDSQGTINRATGVGKGFDNGAREWSAARKMVGGVTSDKTKKRFSEVQKGRKYKGVLFLIDEVSMLDTCLGYVISEGLEINQRDEAAVNKARKTPIQWLCVGDFKQLEPVGGEMIMHQAVFNHKGEEVIEASLMEKLDMKLINLKQQMRQAEGSEFAQELNLLALGGGHGKHRELENCPLIKGRLKASLDEMPEDALHVFAGNDELIEWNRQELAKLKAKGNRSKVYSANISVNDRSYTRASFVDYFKPLEEHLELAVGAPVTIKHKIVDPNNTNAPLPLAANGSRGVIVALNDDSVDVKLSNGNIIEIGRVDLHAPLDENHIPVGRFNQIPIVLAWATTFHGCQGMTEDKVVVHAYRRKKVRQGDGQEVDVVLNGQEYGEKIAMNQNNAFYVGCSRVRELKDLYFYTGCDTVDLVTETKEQRNYRANTYRRLMFNSYKTNLHVINWLKEQAVC